MFLLAIAALAQGPAEPPSGVALWPVLVIVGVIAGLCLLILIAQMTDPRRRRETQAPLGKKPTGIVDSSDSEGESIAGAGAGPDIAASNVDRPDPPAETERGGSQRGAH